MDVELMVKSIVAMACLTTLEMTALIMGVDGAVFAVVVAAVAGLGGYTIGKKAVTPEELEDGSGSTT